MMRRRTCTCASGCGCAMAPPTGPPIPCTTELVFPDPVVPDQKVLGPSKPIITIIYCSSLQSPSEKVRLDLYRVGFCLGIWVDGEERANGILLCAPDGPNRSAETQRNITNQCKDIQETSELHCFLKHSATC